MNDVNRRIFELIHSGEVSDKLAGIVAIGTVFLHNSIRNGIPFGFVSLLDLLYMSTDC
jgi:hypothetical protein